MNKTSNHLKRLSKAPKTLRQLFRIQLFVWAFRAKQGVPLFGALKVALKEKAGKEGSLSYLLGQTENLAMPLRVAHIEVLRCEDITFP